MGRVTVTSNMNQVKREETQRMRKALFKWALDTHNVARRKAPHKHGHLRRSGSFKQSGEMEWEVSFGNSQVPYARIQHEGGTIKPKNAKALAFRVGDKLVFAKSVTIKGTPYLKDAAEANSRNFTARYMR